jgi:ribonuclease III
MNDVSHSAEALGLTFTDLDLLEEALTHRSYLNEHRDARVHNERLEFLGDAVLELAVTRFLFDTYPGKPEGELTAFRAALVNTDSLADTAEGLGISDMLFLSKGEAKDIGRARRIILANAFEAVLGAIYLDQGFEAAEAFVAKHLYPKLDGVIKARAWQDPKSRFQELAQQKEGKTPWYRTVEEVGPDHDKQFTVSALVGEREVARGQGRSKQEAELAAASAALSQGY